MRGGLRLVLAIALIAVPAACRPAAADERVETVEITIHYSHFDPSTFAFAPGTTVRFVVHNTDPIDHEFILGSPAVQEHIEHTAHPEHDGSVPGQISVPAGSTVETTYTFGRRGTVLLGCHIAGHYAYGMRGSVRVS